MKKRLLSLAIVLCMVLSVLPAGVFAAGEESTGPVTVDVSAGTLDFYADGYTVDGKNFTSAGTSYVLTGNGTREINFHASSRDGVEAPVSYDITLQNLNVKTETWRSCVIIDENVTVNLTSLGNNSLFGYNWAGIAGNGSLNILSIDGSLTLGRQSGEDEGGVSESIALSVPEGLCVPLDANGVVNWSKPLGQKITVYSEHQNVVDGVCKRCTLTPIVGVDGVYYGDMAEAIANADGKTIELLTNVETTESVTLPTSCQIDFADYTWTLHGENALIVPEGCSSSWEGDEVTSGFRGTDATILIAGEVVAGYAGFNVPMVVTGELIMDVGYYTSVAADAPGKLSLYYDEWIVVLADGTKLGDLSEITSLENFTVDYCEHIDVSDDGVCKLCGYQYAVKVVGADGKAKFHIWPDSALLEADHNSRVVMLKDDYEYSMESSDRGASVVLDLNGKTLEVGGYLAVYTGALEITDSAGGGAMEFNPDEQGLCNYGEFPRLKLTGGSYVNLTATGYTLAELLPMGYYYAQDGVAVQLTEGQRQILGTVSVVKCQHPNYVEGVCPDCGMTCIHDLDANGLCGNCGYQCPHTTMIEGVCFDCGYACVHGSFDENYHCQVCGAKCPHSSYTDEVCDACGSLAYMTVTVTDPATAETTVTYCSDFGLALKKAYDWSTAQYPAQIKLLRDVELDYGMEILFSYIDLDLNGKTLGMKEDSYGSALYLCDTTMTIRDSGSGGTLLNPNGECVYVDYDSHLTLHSGALIGNGGIGCYQSTIDLRGGQIGGQYTDMYGDTYYTDDVLRVDESTVNIYDGVRLYYNSEAVWEDQYANQPSQINIFGGEFYPQGENYTCLVTLMQEGTTVQISGGTFHDRLYIRNYSMEEDMLLSQLLAEGYFFVKEDGTALDSAATGYDATLTVGKKFTVTWANEDGTTLETDYVFTGMTPEYNGQAPAKAPTAQYSYTFAGWDKEIVPATGDVTYTATYSATVNCYTITWLNEDGTVLETDTDAAYGTQPSYGGAVPTKAANPQYSYFFDGWTPELTAVTGDATYTAVFTPVLNGYTVTWVNEDGTVLETDTDVKYGNMPSYDGATPTKAATAQYSYTFAGWEPEVNAVAGEVTYTATYTASINSYTITYVADGKVVSTQTVEYGADAVAPEIPAKEGYTDAAPSWDADGKAIVADTTITAVYVPNLYTVTFVIDGVEVATVTVAHGEVAKGPAIPEKEGYKAEWDVKDAITGNTVITAVYTPKPVTPATGDSAHVVLWAVLVLASAAALVLLNKKKRII